MLVPGGCVAYGDDGRICGKPATIVDHLRGGMVCAAHPPAGPARVPCAQCKDEATWIGTKEVVPYCGVHVSDAGDFRVRMTGWDRDFWTYTLAARHPPTVYQLVCEPGAEMQSVRIAFLERYIVIHGDLCPGRRFHDNAGVVCAVGYDRAWFVDATSEDYLCGKFLERVFVGDKAAGVVRDAIDQGRFEGKRTELEELAGRADSIDGQRDAHDIEEWKYDLYRLTEDGELVDDCHGYDPTNASLLCAIQRRFRALWITRTADLGRARQVCTCLGICKGAATLGEGWKCALEAP